MNIFLTLILGLVSSLIIIMVIYGLTQFIHLLIVFIHWFFTYFEDNDYYFFGIIFSLSIGFVISVTTSLITPNNFISIFSLMTYICLIIDSILCIGLRINFFFRKISLFILMSCLCFSFFTIITKEAFVKYSSYKYLFAAATLFLMFRINVIYMSKLINMQRQHKSLNVSLYSGLNGNLLFLENLGLGSLIVILIFPNIARFNWLIPYKNNVNANIYQALIVVSLSFILSVIINIISRFWVIRIYYPHRIRYIFMLCFKYIKAPIITMVSIIMMILIMIVFSPNVMISRQLKDYSWNVHIKINKNKYNLSNMYISSNRIKIPNNMTYRENNKHIKDLKNCKINFNLKNNRLKISSNNKKSHALLDHKYSIKFDLFRFTNNGHYYFKSIGKHKFVKFDISPTKESLIK